MALAHRGGVKRRRPTHLQSKRHPRLPDQRSAGPQPHFPTDVIYGLFLGLIDPLLDRTWVAFSFGPDPINR